MLDSGSGGVIKTVDGLFHFLLDFETSSQVLGIIDLLPSLIFNPFFDGSRANIDVELLVDLQEDFLKGCN